MKRKERERILNQGAVRGDDPRDRAQGRALARDLEGSPARGRRLTFRLRNFRPAEDSYLAALGGPLPYMRRLRQVEDEVAAHEADLARRWRELAARNGRDADAFARSWRRQAERRNFVAVNVLIAKHNHYYPIEARLPMDPRAGDFVLMGGKDYRQRPLDSAWVLERFSAVLTDAREAA